MSYPGINKIWTILFHTYSYVRQLKEEKEQISKIPSTFIHLLLTFSNGESKSSPAIEYDLSILVTQDSRNLTNHSFFYTVVLTLMIQGPQITSFAL